MIREGDLEALESATIFAAWWKPKCIASNGRVKGGAVRCFDGQVAELQMRAAILNRFNMLGCQCMVAVT